VVLADDQELTHLRGMSEPELIVGVISDTHGLLRPQAVAAMRGADLIIHAGDVGSRDIVKALADIAPTFAVRGNVDNGAWAADLPTTELVKVGERRFFVLHQISELDFDPAAAGFDAVVFGHSHQPLIDTRGDVLYLNPGSAGPRRFNLPIAVARVAVSGGRLHPQIVELEV
jgi:putative phosphoesterase